MLRSILTTASTALLVAGLGMAAQAQTPAAPGTPKAAGKSGANVGSLTCKVAGGMGVAGEFVLDDGALTNQLVARFIDGDPLEPRPVEARGVRRGRHGSRSAVARTTSTVRSTTNASPSHAPESNLSRENTRP